MDFAIMILCWLVGMFAALMIAAGLVAARNWR
jgi:hypothetical protein